MPELLSTILGIGLAGFALALVALSGLAYRRFGERQFLLVSSGFGILAAVAALSVLSENLGLWDEAFAVEPAPLALLVVFAGLVFVALVPRGSASAPVGHG